MRKVKLYTIKEDELLAGDRVRIHDMAMSIADVVYTDTNETLFNPNMVNIPVHRVSRIQHGERKDDYIAIHPQLEEILRAPVIGEIDELKHKIKCLRQDIRLIESDRAALLERIHNYNDLPWFKKIFKKV